MVADSAEIVARGTVAELTYRDPHAKFLDLEPVTVTLKVSHYFKGGPREFVKDGSRNGERVKFFVVHLSGTEEFARLKATGQPAR